MTEEGEKGVRDLKRISVKKKKNKYACEKYYTRAHHERKARREWSVDEAVVKKMENKSVDYGDYLFFFFIPVSKNVSR
jgi:hypothetical protein